MEWEVSNINNIVAFINGELASGRAMNDIERVEFNVNDRVIHKRLARLHYKKIDNQYLLNSDVQKNNIPKPKNEEVKKPKDNVIIENKIIEMPLNSNIQMPTEIFEGNNINALFELIHLLEPLKAIVERGNIVEIDKLEDNIKPVGDTISKSFRIGADVWSKLEKFLSEHKQYKTQELITLALKEFLDKYDK